MNERSNVYVNSWAWSRLKLIFWTHTCINMFTLMYIYMCTREYCLCLRTCVDMITLLCIYTRRCNCACVFSARSRSCADTLVLKWWCVHIRVGMITLIFTAHIYRKVRPWAHSCVHTQLGIVALMRTTPCRLRWSCRSWMVKLIFTVRVYVHMSADGCYLYAHMWAWLRFCVRAHAGMISCFCAHTRVSMIAIMCMHTDLISAR